ncbi:MAG: hypothetical protein ACRDJN_24335 [Chloroflexota bacterium]
MQSATIRCLILIGVLATGAWLSAAIGEARVVPAARWPAESALYAVPGWTAGPAAVETIHGATLVQRHYLRPDGTTATLAVTTSPEAKRIYKAGAEVPFLGGGYTVDQAPPSIAPPAPGRGALIASREREAWLVLYTFGERRGLLGNGVLGWGMVALDATLGRPNDYYRASLMAPLTALDSLAAREVVALADTLFPRLATWYAGT